MRITIPEDMKYFCVIEIAMLSGGGIPGMTAATDYPAETADYDEEQEDTENE